jgi:lipopolysaccharide biosynthesis glycosyltransferase
VELSIVYSSDNNYAQHVGVSIISLFENNKEFDEIKVYLIDNHISPSNKNKLNTICEAYNRKIRFIEFSDFSSKIKLNIGDSISISSYARLFIPSMLGDEVNKVIYLDCDSIINSSIKDLWCMDISEHYVAGVCDTVSPETKLKVNMGAQHPYLNAGMLLINLKKWREDRVEEKFINFIDSFNGKVFHHDQGTINGVLNSKFLILHPKYNCMTIFFTMNREELMQFYGIKDYYSEMELNEAINNPIFIHYTPAFVNRPWVRGCRHPLVSHYKQYLNMTPWKETELYKDQRRLGEKAVAFLYNHLPFKMANNLCNFIFK